MTQTLGMQPAAGRNAPQPLSQGGTANLADILERVLDKGVVIAGDIKINLLDIELLTIKLRLLVASVDKAKEMGIDWWEYDPSLSSGARRDLAAENQALRERIAALEDDGAAAPLPGGTSETSGQPAEEESGQAAGTSREEGR